MTHELKRIEDLKPAPYNPREIEPEAAAGLKASVTQFGDLSGIVWNSRTGHLVCGHQRLKALQDARATFSPGIPEEHEAACFTLKDREFFVRVVDWDEPTERAANVTANNPHISGQFEDDGLQAVLASIQDEVPVFEEVRLDLLLYDPLGEGFEIGDEEGAENPYSQKIESPIYEPSGEQPSPTELVDTQKRDALLKRIDSAKNLSKESRAFLCASAQRMLVFNYEKIANYYAHANAEEQDLFERLALIIIDFDKAIEYGFVRMSEEIANTYKGDTPR